MDRDVECTFRIRCHCPIPKPIRQVPCEGKLNGSDHRFARMVLPFSTGMVMMKGRAEVLFFSRANFLHEAQNASDWANDALLWKTPN